MVILGFLVTIVITFIIQPFFKDKGEIYRIAARAWAKFFVFAAGIKVEVSGSENVPQGQAVIIAANHQSATDPVFALACMPITLRFVTKKELFKFPIYGWYIRKAGYLSIDRKAILSAYRTVEQIVEAIRSGGSVLVFPEGTRTKTGELGKFKRGSLLAALKSGAPIIPLAISGSFHLLRQGTWLINRHPVKVTIGKPIYVRSEEDYNNKVVEVHNAIESML